MSLNLALKSPPLDSAWPWLMLPDRHRHAPYDDEAHNNQSLKCFFSLYTCQIHCLPLPEAAEKAVCGSSLGWLIIQDEHTSAVTLINPLNRIQINLPNLSSSLFDNQDSSFVLHKAILSSDPSRFPCNYIVFAIFGDKRRLVYYKARDRTWTMIQDAGSYYDDIICRKEEELLATNENGKVVSCHFDKDIKEDDDDSFSSPRIDEISYPFFFKGGKVYLADIDRGLVMLLRFVQDSSLNGHETYNFEAYIYGEEERKWLPIDNLAGWTIFVGHNQTTAVEGGHYEGMIKPNCVYFTDDRMDTEESLVVGNDSGIFNMEDGKVEPVECSLSDDLMYVWPRPVWFMSSTP